MNEQDKQLLLKDLSSRIPYGVILHDEYEKKDYKLDCIDANGFINYDIANRITHIKPYLRPMSSITEEEENFIYNGHIDFWRREDYCNKHYLDYRGLISIGLALEAQEGMYDTKQ